MRRFFVLLFLNFSAFLLSQNVSGVVTDEDENALPAVMVFNMQTGEKAYTDTGGKFSIKAAADSELRFVRKGFERESKIINTTDFTTSLIVSLVRMAQEIEEVEVSFLKLTGDLNRDSQNLTKVDRVAQVEKAVGVPGPPEKPREKPAEFKKDVVNSLLGLSVKPQAIYDLISGDARRMKAEYRYEDLQENIAWIKERVDEDYFDKMGISSLHISAFLQFSLTTEPQISDAVKNKNLSKTLFLLEKTLPRYLKR